MFHRTEYDKDAKVAPHSHALQGKNGEVKAHAIEITRSTMGATSPVKAAPGTIRADYALEIGRNLVHGSDGPETAAAEIALWFGEGEILSYQRDVDRWILE